MNIEHFVEDKNIKLVENAIINGENIKAGTKIIAILRQGNYLGYKMRVPPPEFEALLFFTALDSAAKAEILKKDIVFNKSKSDGLLEVDLEDQNRLNFYNMCQYGMASVAFAVSAIESWANNSIAIYGLNNGKPTELTMRRPNKTDKKIMSNQVASDISIPIRPKLFQLVPQVFSCPPLKEHSALKRKVGNIIEERNIIMHMQNTLKLSDKEVERVNYAVKLFKVNCFMAPEIMLQYINYIYKNSQIGDSIWIATAKKELYKLKKSLK
jgi:hypothetical protein